MLLYLRVENCLLIKNPFSIINKVYNSREWRRDQDIQNLIETTILIIHHIRIHIQNILKKILWFGKHQHLENQKREKSLKFNPLKRDQREVKSTLEVKEKKKAVKETMIDHG